MPKSKGWIIHDISPELRVQFVVSQLQYELDHAAGPRPILNHSTIRRD
jgi:hypothetical protein